MADRPASWAHYGMGEVLDVFEERHAKGEPPFGDALEGMDFLRGQSDLRGCRVSLCCAPGWCLAW